MAYTVVHKSLQVVHDGLPAETTRLDLDPCRDRRDPLELRPRRTDRRRRRACHRHPVRPHRRDRAGRADRGLCHALDIVAVSIYVAGLLSMLVLSATYNLWPVSRDQMGAAPLRPFRDLCPDRGDLHAVHHGTEGQRDGAGAADRRLVRRDLRHRAEARLAGPVRPGRGRALSRARLERRDAL